MKELCCLILLFTISLYAASRFNMASKIPVKSIKSPDGDIIDCVDIYHQPAFDHPLLKNHTILMKPSHYPEKGPFGESKAFNFKGHSEKDTKSITQFWQLNGKCPEGTIPIRRTKKEDFLRARSIKSKSIPHFYSADTKFVNGDPREFALAYIEDKFSGGKAIINVWEPQVQSSDEYSSSGMWIMGGSGANLNVILDGWMVGPCMYGDSQTRLFIYWTRDGAHSTGCFNLFCSGFVQLDNKIALGATIKPVSVYHGSQNDITIEIWKDRGRNVWWLRYGVDTMIGYWPASLFTNLADRASVVEWGGEVVNYNSGGQHTETQMGSGHFAEERFEGASFFRNLQVIDGSYIYRSPGKQLRTIAEQPNCYNITLGNSKEWGDFFYYGGPGKNPKCP